MIKKIGFIILSLIVLSQFIQPKKNRHDQEETHYAEFAKEHAIDPTVQTLLVNACYDCHSEHTRYPWYSNITPVNFAMAQHVKEGKQKFNFAEFKNYSPKKLDHKLEEMVEEIEEGEMPMQVYTAMHKTAKLSDFDKEILIIWANEIGRAHV